ncbi:MAG: DUF4062 domain-containing protein, partial [Anaerolineae bacterium]|nr:DUF4062 domain-containing protein [Anaerolineae bacterium]
MPTQSRRADVLISTTLRDTAYLKAARDAILRVDMFPMMVEQFEGSDEVTVVLRRVDEAEIYTGILGGRYGYVPKNPERNPERLSIMEIAYRRATERGIPILVFIRRDINNTLEEVDVDPGLIDRLNRFKGHLQKNHTVYFFETPDDLRKGLLEALSRLRSPAELQRIRDLYRAWVDT